MTPAGRLLVELWRTGVTVEAHGDRLRYSPAEKMTPELVERLREHKPAILATLTRKLLPEAKALDMPAAVEAAPLSATPTGGLDVVANEGLDAGPGWLDGSDEVDPAPCTSCGGLELWESAWRSARTTDPKPQRVAPAGEWHCCRCEPPEAALRLLELVERLRGRRATLAPNERKASASNVESTAASGPENAITAS